ncbi:MAG: hypothetical protein FJW23_10975 [Acidimicrobiia bacterium]|nr:hypothetical protein [Acidimicrobiia bacterium]
MTPSGPDVRAIVAFLESVDPVATVHLPPGLATRPVRAVRTFADAVDGDLSWLSPRAAERRADLSRTFRGTLLCAPLGLDVSGLASAVVRCRSPKLAFGRVVTHFFPDLLVTAWPPHGRQVHEGARVHPRASLGPGVVVGSNTTIGEDVVIGPNTVIANADLGARVSVGASCTIGLPGFGYAEDASGRRERFPHLGRVIIEDGVEIGSNTCIDRGSLADTVIGAGSKVDNLVHIAHNVRVGAHSVIVAHAMVGGSVSLGEGVWCAPGASIRNQLVIGAGATVGMGAVVVRDVPPGETVAGNPARPLDRDRGARRSEA